MRGIVCRVHGQSGHIVIEADCKFVLAELVGVVELKEGDQVVGDLDNLGHVTLRLPSRPDGESFDAFIQGMYEREPPPPRRS